jgi:small subunit ribosomal protein S4
MAKAVRFRGVTGTVLLQLLERRLDNVVYRAGYAITRRGGRQLVRHNHVYVNGQRVNIPSYSVRPGDVITISEAAKKNPHVLQAQEFVRMDGRKAWLDYNDGDMSTKFAQIPSREDLDDLPIKEQLIVELYSK